MDIFYSFATDPVLEEQGKEFQIGKDAFITVARTGNRVYIMRALLAAHKETLDRDDDEAHDRFEKIQIEVLAKSVLLGFRGITFKGETLTYSQANAAMLLEIKDFRDLVAKHADKFTNFLVKQEEEDVKKSQTTSSGSQTGEVA